VIDISSPSLGLDGCAACSPVILEKDRIKSRKLFEIRKPGKILKLKSNLTVTLIGDTPLD